MTRATARQRRAKLAAGISLRRPPREQTPTLQTQECPSHQEAYDHPLLQAMFYVIIASIPFFRWRQLPIADIKIDWLLTALLVLFLAPYLVIQKQPPRRLSGSIWSPLVLFLLANFIAYLVSPFPEQALSGLISLLMGFLFIVITGLMISDTGFEKTMPFTLGVSMGAGALMSALGYFANVEIFSQIQGERAYGGSISANNMALMCVFVFPVMVHWAVYAKTPQMRMTGIALAGLQFLGMISTVSRGGFLSIILISILLVLQYRKKFQPKHLGLVVAIAGAGVIVAASVIPKEFFIRQASLITEGTQDKSLDRRSSYVIVAMDAIEERPLIGWGTDVFKKIWVRSEETKKFKMEERPAHNTYLEVSVGSGIIGITAFLLLMWRAFYGFHSSEKRLMKHGFESEAQLCAAYKLSLLAVMLYFLIKSGLDHKYFLMILPLSTAAVRFANSKLTQTSDSTPKAALTDKSPRGNQHV